MMKFHETCAKTGYLRVTAICILSLALQAPVSASLFDIFTGGSLTNGSRYAFVPSKNEPIVVAIDTSKNEVADVLELPHIPGSVVISDKLGLMFATDPENNGVTVLNLATKEITEYLDIGMRPDAALLNPFDIYVAFGSRDGSVSVWDMANFREMFRVDGLEAAINLTFSFDGSNLYVVEEKKKNIAIIEMYSKGKIADIPLGGDPDGAAEVSAISRSANGHTGFVSVTSENRVVILDLINLKIKKSISVNREPVRPYSTSDNRYVLIPHRAGKTLTVLSPLSYQVIASVPVDVEALELNTGWLDTVAFIMASNENKIAVVDLDRLRQSGSITLAGNPDKGLVTSDSRKLFTALTGTGMIAAIDARTRKLEDVIETPSTSLSGIKIAISNNICH